LQGDVSSVKSSIKEDIMRTRASLVLVVVAVFLVAASLVSAQQWKGWRGSSGWGPGSSYMKMYNPRTVETIKGTVEAVNRIRPAKGMSYGIHVMVKTDKGSVDVHLGPQWYIENQDVKIEPGDDVEVRGSRVIYQNAPTLIAAQVTKGGSVLVLRDDAGAPVWAGWRKNTR
jgi:hypothetical protein